MHRLVGTHTYVLKFAICHQPTCHPTTLCMRATQNDTFNGILCSNDKNEQLHNLLLCAFINIYFQILNAIHMVLPLLQSTTHHQPNEISNEFNFKTLSKLAARMTNWDGIGSGVSSASSENVTHQRERNIQIAATLLLNQKNT